MEMKKQGDEVVQDEPKSKQEDEDEEDEEEEQEEEESERQTPESPESGQRLIQCDCSIVGRIIMSIMQF